MVFGHRMCFGRYRVLNGSPEGVSGTPRKDVGLMVQVKEHTSPLWAGLSLPWRIKPIYMSGVSGTPSGDPISSRYVPKHFWCPNTIVLYINIYLSTISRLLVMSVISSETPNNIRSPNHITHIILYIVIKH